MDEGDKAIYCATALWDGAGIQELVVHYQDGSEYVVERFGDEEAEQNMISGGINGNTGAYMTIFNRFADTAAVADISVTTSDGTPYSFRPAA